jgi:hypothetical protein
LEVVEASLGGSYLTVPLPVFLRVKNALEDAPQSSVIGVGIVFGRPNDHERIGVE